MNGALRIRNVLLRTFLLSYLMVLGVWWLSSADWYYRLLNYFYPMSQMEMRTFFLYVISFAKIMAVMFFLLPALAIHLEYRRDRKKEEAQ